MDFFCLAFPRRFIQLNREAIPCHYFSCVCFHCCFSLFKKYFLCTHNSFDTPRLAADPFRLQYQTCHLFPFGKCWRGMLSQNNNVVDVLRFSLYSLLLFNTIYYPGVLPLFSCAVSIHVWKVENTDVWLVRNYGHSVVANCLFAPHHLTRIDLWGLSNEKSVAVQWPGGVSGAKHSLVLNYIEFLL